ncbi:hypothetical protein [Parabacteroides sp. PF5-9]|uniref:TolB family protein n=1 Tax=Parabacteroides sp. PF5-9 TaxID=1742404 RepID=UPI002475FFA0|nr:hypothetical protein [Parabacteroides sp. PF5-9]MDH6356766.1 hypothetical protein [Parabacteroides sp. PF5-9]
MKKNITLIGILLFCVFACSPPTHDYTALGVEPDIYPDYAGVTIPPNIAPLNFELKDPHIEAYVLFSVANDSFRIKSKKGQFHIPAKKWKNILKTASGKTIDVSLRMKNDKGWGIFNSFNITVAREPIDPYIAYRLIKPGYELWHQMGIYQRNLENYTESAIIENRITDNNCMNCHSFCMQDPEQMLLHMRDKHAGTIFIQNGKIEKINTKTDQTMSSLVYPSWHPSGKYVAFSVNLTNQSFHRNNRNRIEVYDSNSDVVVYDTENYKIITSELLFDEKAFETFPTFSPDGKTLYFCSADAQPMPQTYNELRYSLCSISFDPATSTFGTQVDTLYNTRTQGGSVSIPRVSPDGNYLLYTLGDYGNFMIWHKEADLHMINLRTGEHYPLNKANSQDVDSYHSWSSNSRWVVFSSRRGDGLYTRPYFAYIDDAGQAAKPFLLPQKDSEYYDRCMESYNVPEFITGKVKQQARKISLVARDSGNDITFAGKNF